MFTIIRVIILAIIGLILINTGIDVDTWQYWIIMILTGVVTPIVSFHEEDEEIKKRSNKNGK